MLPCLTNHRRTRAFLCFYISIYRISPFFHWYTPPPNPSFPLPPPCAPFLRHFLYVVAHLLRFAVLCQEQSRGQERQLDIQPQTLFEEYSGKHRVLSRFFATSHSCHRFHEIGRYYCQNLRQW